MSQDNNLSYYTILEKMEILYLYMILHLIKFQLYEDSV